MKSEGVHRVLLENLKGKEFTKKEDVSGLVSQLCNGDGDQIAWHTSTILKYVKKFNFSWDWKAFYKWTPYLGVVFLLYCVLFLIIQAVFQKKLSSRTKYGNTFGIGLFVVFICAVIESILTVLSYYHSDILDVKEAKTITAVIVSFIPIVFAGKAAEHVSKLRGKLTLYLLGALGPFIIFIIYLMLCSWVLNSPRPFSYEAIIFVAFAVFGFTRIFADINITSFHDFYRDQLSKTYLFLADREGNNVRPNDEQKLSNLNKEDTRAPYHLINVVLNLQGSSDVSLRDRNGDFFVFSKHFCGGLKTGFCKTVDMEKADSHINLGTAMAISGAAAAPNMGTTTTKPLVFIMALLNIRLGYWIPNPHRLKDVGYSWLRYNSRSPLTGVGPYYLIRELFGWITEDSKYVNVSDGGHIENLGVYELLRRKCKYIIVCDAEADPDMTFGGLAKVIRYARIDLSIDIEIDLDGLRKGENGFSKKHCALGKIFYGGEETGYLLYIKASLTGGENEYIREYRSRNEDFPHESTADQFFDEAQFEAYRALGHHIADKLDGWEVLKTGKELAKIGSWCNECETEREMVRNAINQKEENLDEWLKYLDKALLPQYQVEDTFVELQEQLSKIEKMYQDSDIAVYAYQVYPELQQKGIKAETSAKKGLQPAGQGGNQGSLISVGGITIEEERFRKIFHFCNQQMQLMENVFIVLKLGKQQHRNHHFSRGWMNLFRRWAEAQLFRQSWAVSIGTYSLDFQMFCEQVLNLCRIVRCRPGNADELTPQELAYFTDEKQRNYRFFGEDKKLLSPYSIWIAEMSVCNRNNVNAQQTEVFPIGFAIVKRMGGQDSCNDLVYYHIRSYYRRMKLLEKMIPGLIHKMGNKEKMKFRVIFNDEEERRRYSYFFERYGILCMVSQNVGK